VPPWSAVDRRIPVTRTPAAATARRCALRANHPFFRAELLNRGISAAWDGTPVTAAAMVQGQTDTCYRMKVEAFRREIDRQAVTRGWQTADERPL
jgi:hypothetical protein